MTHLLNSPLMLASAFSLPTQQPQQSGIFREPLACFQVSLWLHSHTQAETVQTQGLSPQHPHVTVLRLWFPFTGTPVPVRTQPS